MENRLLWIARALGLIGLALCSASVTARVVGLYYVASLQTGTLLLGGIAALSVASLAYLAVLVEFKRG